MMLSKGTRSLHLSYSLFWILICFDSLLLNGLCQGDHPGQVSEPYGTQLDLVQSTKLLAYLNRLSIDKGDIR